MIYVFVLILVLDEESMLRVFETKSKSECQTKCGDFFKHVVQAENNAESNSIQSQCNFI